MACVTDDTPLCMTWQAVDSMLSSLDPYTEFEGEQLAQDMRESVSGRSGAHLCVPSPSRGEGWSLC